MTVLATGTPCWSGRTWPRRPRGARARPTWPSTRWIPGRRPPPPPAPADAPRLRPRRAAGGSADRRRKRRARARARAAGALRLRASASPRCTTSCRRWSATASKTSRSIRRRGTPPSAPAGGMLVWRPADDWLAFTDGDRTWVYGPDGLRPRLNTERYIWETDAGRAGTTLIALAAAAAAGRALRPDRPGGRDRRFGHDRAVPALQQAIEGIEVDASTSRQVAPGIVTLRERLAAGQLGEVVVVHLGNNGTFTARQFDETMQALQGVRRVVFVTVKVPRPWEGPNNAVLARRRRALPERRAGGLAGGERRAAGLLRHRRHPPGRDRRPGLRRPDRRLRARALNDPPLAGRWTLTAGRPGRSAPRGRRRSPARRAPRRSGRRRGRRWPHPAPAKRRRWG